MEILEWLSNWFASECDGDWEHENIIRIVTVSNPGWFVSIDLKLTAIEKFEYDMDTVELSPNDWYFMQFKDGKFTASGDLQKLEFLLNEFRRIVEEQSS